MNYLFYGQEDYLINNAIDKINNSNNIDKLNIIRYTYQNNIKNILDDANTYSLFDSKKLIIIEDFNLTTDEEEIKLLEDYFKNYNDLTILVFICNVIKLDERKKITKIFKKYCKVLEFNKISNPISIVKDMFNGYDIDYSTITYFIDYVGNNLDVLNNEADKLKYYALNNKITKDDINKVCTNNIDTDIFNLVELSTLKKKKDALNVYYAMINNGEEAIKILIMLANQFRIIYQAKNLYLKGYSEADIASTLKIHPYRIKLALEKGRGINNKDLIKYLYLLAQLDIDIKTNKIDKNLGLELFIIEM